MVTFATLGDRIDRLTGVYQEPPTDFSDGDIADFYAYCSELRTAQLRREGSFAMREKEWPEAAIEHATVRTQYVPVYRIHAKDRFLTGPNWFKNWQSSEWRAAQSHRYSPPGTEGYYFGLTLEAAESEARYAGGGQISSHEKMILVIESCFDNLLYLPPVLPAVWQVVGLPPPTSPLGTLLAIMDPATDNPATNAIGEWARQKGFAGLIYPTARYTDPQKHKHISFTGKYPIIPVINYVDLGIHIPNHALNSGWMPAINCEIRRHGGLEHVIPLFADLNIVLFSGDQIAGKNWGIIYQTFPLEMRAAVLAQDDPNRVFSSYFTWASDTRPPWLK